MAASVWPFIWGIVVGCVLAAAVIAFEIWQEWKRGGH